MSDRYNQTEGERRLENVLQYGVVDSVNYGNATMRVKVGDALSGDLAIGTRRAGNDSDWAVYEVGEQVLIACPSGELSDGVVICAIYSDKFPAKQARPDVRSVDFGDGAQVIYDRAAHHMIVNVADGSAEITAKKGITINGNIQLNGGLNATDDVVADGISLIEHVHGSVRAGTQKSGKPE